VLSRGLRGGIGGWSGVRVVDLGGSAGSNRRRRRTGGFPLTERRKLEIAELDLRQAAARTRDARRRRTWSWLDARRWRARGRPRAAWCTNGRDMPTVPLVARLRISNQNH